MQKWVRARWNFAGDAAHLENVCALQVLLMAVKPAAQGCSARPYGATDGKKPIEIVDARVDAILLNLPVAATCQRAAHLGRSDEQLVSAAVELMLQAVKRPRVRRAAPAAGEAPTWRVPPWAAMDDAERARHAKAAHEMAGGIVAEARRALSQSVS